MNIHATRKLLQNPYAYLNDLGEFDVLARIITGTLKDHENPWRCEDHEINSTLRVRKPYQNREIEAIARKIQLQLWTDRHRLFPKKTTDILPVEVLDPEVAINQLGYSVETVGTLGDFSFEEGFYEVAGAINMHEGTVHISRMFKPEVQRFTLAHELGHALLHEKMVYHRDRPIHCPDHPRGRPLKEREADKFASYFLMPELQVRKEFAKRFGEGPLALNEHTAFGLTAEPLPAFSKRVRDLRDFSRIIASANGFLGFDFQPLSKVFGVSVEAMAIRLEELNLVNF